MGTNSKFWYWPQVTNLCRGREEDRGWLAFPMISVPSLMTHVLAFGSLDWYVTET